MAEDAVRSEGTYSAPLGSETFRLSLAKADIGLSFIKIYLLHTIGIQRIFVEYKIGYLPSFQDLSFLVTVL